MTNSISEVVDADVILVCGSNTTETHPVIGAQIRQAVNRGAKLIVADPREIPLAEEAEVFLPIRPGTNVALLNGMMNVIINEGLLDKEYVENRTEGFDELWEIVKEYTADKVGMICGIDPEDLKKAARLYATAERAPIFYAMGITQHTTGTAGVMSTANLALLCGKVGKYGCGVNPLRGQNNVQGACDMGCLPGDYTGYQKVANPEARAKFEAFWGVPLPSKPGLTITEILSGAETGDIRCLYIMGENPMVSDANLHHVEQALRRCELLIVQDIFLTETAELADVVLPAACYAEKEGTFTNTERRVQRIRAAVDAPGESREDWIILSEIMSRLGYENSFTSPREILEEIAQITPSYGGFSYDRLEKEQPQWPCPSPEHPGTPILHTAKFSRGERAIFKPSPYMPAAEQPDEHYPFILTTGRILYQYHTRTMTGKSDDINRIAGRSFVEIHPTDAAKKGIAQGDQVKVASRRGEVIVEARVTERVSEGVIFMPFHFAEAPANRLTNNVVDPISKIPEYKVCSAQVQAL
jgi:formate dehydrogenase major subunit